MIGTIAQKEIDAKQEELAALSKKVWDNPEVGFEEVKACKWFAEFLEKEGFQVETGYAGVPTAIRAVWGSGKPVIGLLGEYDALPSLSQKVSTVKEPVEEGAPGQGCGHNLLGTCHLAAALGIKKELEENKLPGTVIFFGCPAEEKLTGKPFMAREGAFKELDFALAWHPNAMNVITTGTCTAMNSAKFHFKGVTAHAGGDPHNGRSALDAAELMNVGAQFLREHVTSDVRIHYSFTEAGGAPNIVPDRASVWYFVRALDRQTVEDVYARLVRIAKGAAMMTDTEVTEEFLGGCYNTLQNKVLVNVIHESMKEVPLPAWTQEEKDFAAELDKVTPNYANLVAAGAVREGEHLAYQVEEIQTADNFGSTDVGDVEHIVPAAMFMTGTYNLGAPGHSWQITACSGNSMGMKGMLYGAKVMALSALKVAEDPALLAKAKEEFQKDMHGTEYICPIPAEVPVG